MNIYLKTVELIKQFEEHSDCAIGQYNECDHLEDVEHFKYKDVVAIRNDRAIIIEAKDEYGF